MSENLRVAAISATAAILGALAGGGTTYLATHGPTMLKIEATSDDSTLRHEVRPASS